MPKVSVIIPVYNVEKYLTRCLDSVCNQTFKDIEIICIDDCSTDGSLSKLKEYAVKDTRIKVIRFEKNCGVSTARNEGLKIAQGEYLGFIDPDDYIDLNFYEELYKEAKKKDYDIVKSQRVKIDLNLKKEKSTLNSMIKEKSKFYFTHEWTTAIYKSSIITKNNIEFPTECRKGQDDVFLNRVILKTEKLSIIENVSYYYVKREGSLHSEHLPIESLKSAVKAYELLEEDRANSSLPIDFFETYLSLLQRSIISLLYLAHRNSDKSAHICCAKSAIQMFKKYWPSKDVQPSSYLKTFVPFFDKNDVEGLIKTLLSCDSPQKLFLASIRQNIKNRDNNA